MTDYRTLAEEEAYAKLCEDRIKVDLSAYNSYEIHGHIYFYVPELDGWVHINDVHGGYVIPDGKLCLYNIAVYLDGKVHKKINQE